MKFKKLRLQPMSVKVYTLNSFAKTAEGGNPAGVVFDSDSFSEQRMMDISKQVGFSETAFVQKSSVADFKVRFFTPNAEVDLCGHATVASYYLMFKLGLIKPGQYTQETKAGLLNLEVQPNGTIFMNQTLPQFFDLVDKDELAYTLGIKTSQFHPTLPAQIVSTGLKDIMIPIGSLRDLIAVEPNFDLISQTSKKYGTIGYHLFTLETKYGSTAQCRNMAPLYDIPEESATGTSNGALSCYLYKQGVITPEQASHLIFEQGYTMGKPSEILASLKVSGDNITEVRVGGIATNIQEIEVF